MSERLTSADVAFFYLESPSTPQHVGGLAVFAAPDGFDYDRLLRLIQERIALAPRYRQKMRAVPGNLANPVWVDDADFDLTYHVRRSALPRPGTEQALLEFCGRIQSRVLDRDRPLWEMYLVEGLAGGRVAITTKTHPSMVDGNAGIDIIDVLLDESPEPRRTVSPLWLPRREPGMPRLVAEALLAAARRPATVLDTVRLSVRDVRASARRLTGTAAAVAAAIGRTERSARHSPLHATLGRHRRIGVARARLDDFRAVRSRRGGSVHDVVLAVVSGALREWLIGRGEQLSPTASVRALVPVGLAGGAPGNKADVRVTGSGAASRLGFGRLTTVLVDLPVGEADPLARLARVQDATSALTSADRPVGADVLVGLSGFAPPTLHSLSARAAHQLTRRMSSLTLTNVPGPQQPLYAAGARMLEMFPIMPVSEGQAISIALTSYDGGIFFGITADRDAVPDVDDITAALTASLQELLRASESGHAAPRQPTARPRRQRRT